MSFLLLGIDSLIAGIAVCAIVGPRARLPLAALFGIADGVVFLIGAGLHWQLAAGVTEALEIGILLSLGVYLLVVATGTQAVTARWPLWVLPWALTMDNLAYGIAGDHSTGALMQTAGEQALSSALLAFAGLSVAVLLPRAVPALAQRAVATRVAGGALVLAAGGFMLVG